MRPAIEKAAWLVGVGALLMIGSPFAGSAQAASGDRVPQCVGVFKTSAVTAPAVRSVQMHHDAQANATFFFSVARDGAVRMTMKAGDLDVEKTVYADGRFRLVLQAGNDRMSVVLGPGLLEVQRGNRRVRLDVGQTSDDDWLRVKTLLAGSRALRLLRTLAFNLEPATLRTPAGTAVMSSDAVLGFLEGDVAAVARLGQQMRAARQARIRTVAFEEEEKDCYKKYEALVVEAADEYDACRHSFYWWDPRQEACIFVWTLQAESAWFQFLGCSAVPLKAQ
jgi:hypothetical protein